MKQNTTLKNFIIHLEGLESIWEHLHLRSAIQYFWLGRQPYISVWELQKQLHSKRVAGEIPDVVLFLEHDHVYTVGRTGSMAEINASEASLLDLGISIYETDRGGQVTYHGPGQLIAYPIIDIRALGGPLKYVRALEQIIIKTLSNYNINALTKDGYTGVWVSDEKIAAIGVKISRGIALHGISLNVNPDLSYFKHIIPCGLVKAQITSMEKILGKPMNVDTIAYSLQYYLGNELGLTLVDSDPAELSALD